MKNNLLLSWPVVFLVVALGLSVFAWWQSSSLEQFSIERTQSELQSRARLFAGEAARLIQRKDLSGLRRFFVTEGKATGTRMTLIADSGEVIADSDENPSNMDNHRLRPEIAEAINAFHEGETAFSTIRHSSTSGRRMIYCAMPLAVDGKQYVLRSAFSIHEIDQIVRKARIDVIWAVVVTILIAAGICYFLFQTVTRPIRALRSASARIAAGDLDAKLPVPERGAIRELGGSMSRMAEELKARIGEISREKSERDAIFAALSEGVVVLDVDELIIDTNRAARRIFQIKGDPRRQPVGALLRNEALNGFLAKLRETDKPDEAEFVFSLPDGDKQLRVRGCTVHWNEDARQGILLVFYDMTQLRKLENFRRDFIANVSHEIKTPLTVIRGAVETLQDGAIGEPQSARRFMEIIATHSERLNSLVQDILSLSQLECRALGEGYDLVTCEMSLPLSSAVKLEEPRAEEAGIRIVSEIVENPAVRIDVQLMEQAIINLVDNAIKHSGEKSEVRLRLYTEDGNAVLEVADHGCGIPPEHLERLFERFYRVDKARSRKAGGTGLGLAIVKHIMQLHRGTAEVKSTPGKGSTFILRLPAVSS
ncbi:MAG: HAMP domain-containing protein [Lentisphaeria bacterium]|nr:HAMP domain-containing protein [Lentisphaeria bacterium]